MNSRTKKYLSAAGSILDLSPTVHVFSTTVKKTYIPVDDAESLYDDWSSVGDEIKGAMRKHERSTRQPVTAGK